MLSLAGIFHLPCTPYLSASVCSSRFCHSASFCRSISAPTQVNEQARILAAVDVQAKRGALDFDGPRAHAPEQR
jgi:hypothetical protein